MADVRDPVVAIDAKVRGATRGRGKHAVNPSSVQMQALNTLFFAPLLSEGCRKQLACASSLEIVPRGTALSIESKRVRSWSDVQYCAHSAAHLACWHANTGGARRGGTGTVCGCRCALNTGRALKSAWTYSREQHPAIASPQTSGLDATAPTPCVRCVRGLVSCGCGQCALATTSRCDAIDSERPRTTCLKRHCRPSADSSGRGGWCRVCGGTRSCACDPAAAQ